jgi:hypothetical protein
MKHYHIIYIFYILLIGCYFVTRWNDNAPSDEKYEERKVYLTVCLLVTLISLSINIYGYTKKLKKEQIVSLGTFTLCCCLIFFIPSLVEDFKLRKDCTIEHSILVQNGRRYSIMYNVSYEDKNYFKIEKCSSLTEADSLLITRYSEGKEYLCLRVINHLWIDFHHLMVYGLTLILWLGVSTLLIVFGVLIIKC